MIHKVKVPKNNRSHDMIDSFGCLELGPQRSQNFIEVRLFTKMRDLFVVPNFI